MDVESFIYKSFSIAFIIVGSFTNILSAIIYSKKKMRKTSYSFYLFALAITDLCVILTGNSRLALIYFGSSSSSNYSNEKHLFDIREQSLFACRLHIFTTYYFLQLSSIILCLLNLDRFCGCVLILKAQKFCKPSIARRAVAFSMLFLFIVDSHFLIAHGDFDSKNETLTKNFKCTANVNNFFYSLFWKGFIYIDGILYCIIPFIIMITCNFMIISKIVRSRIRSKQVVVKRNTIVKNTSSGMLNNEKRISFILLGISFSFLVLTIPVFIIENIGDIDIKNWNIITAFSYMLMYLNHVINFFFYCLLGPRFRREVKELLFCCIPVKTHDKIHHNHYNHHHHHHNQNETKLKPVVKQTNMSYLPTTTRSESSLKKLSFRERANRLLANRINDMTTTSRSVITLTRQQSFNISNTYLNMNRLRKSSSVFECSSLLLTSGLAFFKTRPNTASSIEFNI